MDFAHTSYVRDIARARTFGYAHEVEMLRELGLARGASIDNAIALDEYRILNNDGLRYDDEFVKHKMLDAIGDLYVVGHPLLASYTAYKSGHGLNNALLRELLAHEDAYEIVTFDDTQQSAARFCVRHADGVCLIPAARTAQRIERKISGPDGPLIFWVRDS